MVQFFRMESRSRYSTLRNSFMSATAKRNKEYLMYNCFQNRNVTSIIASAYLGNFMALQTSRQATQCCRCLSLPARC